MNEPNERQHAADNIANELSGGRPRMTGSFDQRQIVELSIDAIRPDEKQPRLVMDVEALNELAQSIQTHGLLQPITVRLDPNDPDGGTYLIVAGHRRFAAHQRLGRERISAIIRRDLDDHAVFALQLVENLQREDLSPLEEAAGYARLMEEFGFTQERVAEEVGRNHTSVSKTLKINQLASKIKDEYTQLPSDRRIGKSTLIEIASADDETKQLFLWEQAKSGANVRMVRGARQEKPAKEPAPLKAGAQKRRLAETAKFAEDFGRDFKKRLAKITDDMLSANPEEAEHLRKVHGQLRDLLQALEAKLAARFPDGENRDELLDREIEQIEGHPAE